MRQNVLAVLIFAVAASPFAQGGQGYGNVLHPGTPSGSSSGGSVLSGGYRGGGGNGGYGSHPAHGRSTVVPYPVIVGGGYYYGGNGYYGGYADPSQQYQDQGAPPPLTSYGAPSVVINQTFIPDHATPSVQEYGGGTDASQDPSSGLRVYEGPKPPVLATRNDLPTIYLIAMKDHTIVQALGYWVENGALHYVSAEHTVNQASMDLIDRDLTQRLNDERNVEFKLPKN